jgi:hypothetical protein
VPEVDGELDELELLGELDELELLGELDEEPEPLVMLLPEVSLLEPELPLVPLEPLEPLLPDDPLEPPEEPAAGTVVVVVTVAEAGALDPVEEEPEVALLFEGSTVVVVLVVWPKLTAAVPIRDRKIAIGNFFMFTPLFALKHCSADQ